MNGTNGMNGANGSICGGGVAIHGVRRISDSRRETSTGPVGDDPYAVDTGRLIRSITLLQSTAA